MKALREGRVPTAGPPGEEQSPDLGEGIPPSISEFPSPPSNFTAPLPPQQPKESTSTPRFDAPPSIPKPAPAPTVVHNVAPAAPVSTVNETQVAAAQKFSKWAISALDYDDIKTARLQLLSALNEIGFNQENNFGYE